MDVVPIFKSRRFWTAVLDLVISLALYFLGKYANPELYEDVKFVIAAIQPVFITLIAAFTVEGAQVIKANRYIALYGDPEIKEDE